MAVGTLTPYPLKKSRLVRIKNSLRLIDLYKRWIIIYSLLLLIAFAFYIFMCLFVTYFFNIFSQYYQ